MVARKPTGKAPSTEVANWDAELAKLGKAQKKTVADVGQGRYIGLARGVMTFNGDPVPDNTISCIVLDSILLNTYYGDVKYKADTPTSPVCYAFGVTDLDDPEADILMAPHEESAAPQNEVCGKAGHDGCCQWNEWESSDTGRGKACQNRRRLGLIPFDEDNCEPGQIAATEHAFINLPVTSVRAWAAYIKKLAGMFDGKPPLAFVTQITVVGDDDDQFHVTFEVLSEVPGNIIGELLKKRLAIQGDMVQPYKKPEDQPKPAARNARSVSKIAGKAPVKAPAKKAAPARR